MVNSRMINTALTETATNAMRRTFKIAGKARPPASIIARRINHAAPAAALCAFAGAANC
jgi:hypothetical protein